MTRLTKKYEDGSGYEPIETHNVCNVNLYDFNYNDYECCVDKLGKIEDLMEKYNIDSVEELDNVLSTKYVIGGMRSSGKTLINKGILYNKISEQLGCPLEVVFEVLKQGYIYVLDNHYNVVDYTITRADIRFSIDKFYIGLGACTRRLSDHQKTWWLKGEKTNE